MLEKEGVDCQSLHVSTEDPSGHAVIQVCSNNGENSILLFPGANFQNTRDEMCQAVDRMDAGDILLMQNEINQPEELLQIAAQKKLRIFWNPAPMTPNVGNCSLDLVDCLIVNEIEAAQLAGIPLNPENHKSLIRIAEILQKKAQQADLVITLGA